MREYDDHIRLYTPVLQRIIILVAVIIAVPVVLWTITAFVRTYVAPPELPTFQRMTTLTQPSDSATTAQANPAPAPAPQQTQLPDSSPPAAGTTSATSQQSNNAPPTLPLQVAPQVSPQVALATPAQPTTATQAEPGAAQAISGPATVAAAPTPSGAVQGTPDKADRVAAPASSDNSFAWPNPPTIAAANTNAGTATGATPTSTDGSADLLPPADPITGRIPLPPRRPRVFAMAQMGGVPMPRPRPQSAASASASTSDTDGPLGWLHNIFQPQNPTQDSSQNP
jgi:cytoskeletal protein RodZ